MSDKRSKKNTTKNNKSNFYKNKKLFKIEV